MDNPKEVIPDDDEIAACSWREYGKPLPDDFDDAVFDREFAKEIKMGGVKVVNAKPSLERG